MHLKEYNHRFIHFLASKQCLGHFSALPSQNRKLGYGIRFRAAEPALKIFAGVGSLRVVKPDFPATGGVWLHLKLTENTDTQQTFTSIVCTAEGEVLIVLEDVVFRRAKPRNRAIMFRQN